MVLAISMPMINGNREVVIQMLCIYYLVQFQEEQVKTLFDSGSKVNAINPNYAQKLEFIIRKTNVGVQNIDCHTLKTFEMVIADFQVEDKASRPRFFYETFLVADIKFEMILEILFLKISNVKVSFYEKTLIWKIYTNNKTLPIIE